MQNYGICKITNFACFSKFHKLVWILGLIIAFVIPLYLGTVSPRCGTLGTIVVTPQFWDVMENKKNEHV